MAEKKKAPVKKAPPKPKLTERQKRIKKLIEAMEKAREV